MRLTYGSLFSGGGGSDIGLDRAGLKCLWQCECDTKCNDVRRYHRDLPCVLDVRDSAAFEPLPSPDVLWMSPPCQDLSVAGKRAGLEGSRSGLFYDAIRVLAGFVRRGTRIALMEQVPGLLSSNAGEDLRAVLNSFLELGACDIAWAVLDSQWFGVPQRRRRVYFAVDFGGECAGEILALAYGLSGHSAPCRETGEKPAASLTRGAESSGRGGYAGRRREDDINLVPIGVDEDYNARIDGMGTLRAHKSGGNSEFVAVRATGQGYWNDDGLAGLRAHPGGTAENLVAVVSDTLTCSSDDGNDLTAGRLVPVAFDPKQITSKANRSKATPGAPNGTLHQSGTQAVAFTMSEMSNGFAWERDIAPTLDAHPASDTSNRQKGIREGMSVRRLMPIECERLQAWGDDYTRYGKREDGAVYELADGPRYRMLGNGVTSTVSEWLGNQVRAVLESSLQVSA